VNHIVDHYGLCTQRACRLVKQARSTFHYRSAKVPQTALRQRIREIAQIRVRYGHRRVHVLLKREGWRVSRKRVYRLYAEEQLQLRSKLPRRRKMVVSRRERCVPVRPNEVWSLDFVADQLADGTRLRALPVVDVFSREALAIDVGKRLHQ
jgi:putative transposase